jgi:hypothetical protein
LNRAHQRKIIEAQIAALRARLEIEAEEARLESEAEKQRETKRLKGLAAIARTRSAHQS